MVRQAVKRACICRVCHASHGKRGRRAPIDSWGITGSCSKENGYENGFCSSKVMKGRIDYMGGDVGPAARASSPPSCMAEQIANDAHLHKLLPPRSSSSTDDGALQARCREESVRD